MVSSKGERIRRFIAEQQDIILKPLDGMGGASIFRLTEDDNNIGVVLETMTQHGKRQVMA